MRILVCGGRHYRNQARVNAVLSALDVESPIKLLMHGGARGADRLAYEWAESVFAPQRAFFAEWHKYGPAAGPLRNQRMLDEGKPDLVIAFPGGRGTADMIAKAKAAGVEVREVGA